LIKLQACWQKLFGLASQAILIKLQACWQNTWWMPFSNMGWLSESLERLIATMG
jgi:hypothetical protein